MDTQTMIAAIDAEIKKLQEVRTLLSQDGKVNAVISKKTVKRARRKPLSKAARAKIAEAQRKRWAAAKRTTK